MNFHIWWFVTKKVKSEKINNIFSFAFLSLLLIVIICSGLEINRKIKISRFPKLLDTWVTAFYHNIWVYPSSDVRTRVHLVIQIEKIDDVKYGDGFSWILFIPETNKQMSDILIVTYFIIYWQNFEKNDLKMIKMYLYRVW